MKPYNWMVVFCSLVPCVSHAEGLSKHDAIATLQGGEQFVTLATNFDQAVTSFFEEMASKETAPTSELVAQILSNPPEPSGNLIPELLSFEAEHRGTLVGLGPN